MRKTPMAVAAFTATRFLLSWLKVRELIRNGARFQLSALSSPWINLRFGSRDSELRIGAEGLRIARLVAERAELAE